MTRDLERRISRLEHPGGDDVISHLAEWLDEARKRAVGQPPETREERRQGCIASIAELEAEERAGTLSPLGQRLLDAKRRTLQDELDDGEAG